MRATLRALYPYRALAPGRDGGADAGDAGGPVRQSDAQGSGRAGEAAGARLSRAAREAGRDVPHHAGRCWSRSTRRRHAAARRARRSCCRMRCPRRATIPPMLEPEWRQTLATSTSMRDQPTGDHDRRRQVRRGAARAMTPTTSWSRSSRATMGSEHDPLPIGTWKIKGAAYNPTFHYNPDLFWDAEAGRRGSDAAAGAERPGRRGLARPVASRITASTARPSRRRSAAPKAMAASA